MKKLLQPVSYYLLFGVLFVGIGKVSRDSKLYSFSHNLDVHLNEEAAQREAERRMQQEAAERRRIEEERQPRQEELDRRAEEERQPRQEELAAQQRLLEESLKN